MPGPSNMLSATRAFARGLSQCVLTGGSEGRGNGCVCGVKGLLVSTQQDITFEQDVVMLQIIALKVAACLLSTPPCSMSRTLGLARSARDAGLVFVVSVVAAQHQQCFRKPEVTNNCVATIAVVVTMICCSTLNSH